MTADQRQRVRELFTQAMSLPPQEWASFLAEACGGDVKLRAEVKSLLEHEQQVTPDFMRPSEPPPGVRRLEPTDGPDPLIGGTVGKYHIKSVIATGGMGTVYEAVQE